MYVFMYLDACMYVYMHIQVRHVTNVHITLSSRYYSVHLTCIHNTYTVCIMWARKMLTYAYKTPKKHMYNISNIKVSKMDTMKHETKRRADSSFCISFHM